MTTHPQTMDPDSADLKKELGLSSSTAAASRTYKLSAMILCAIFGYGLCQLDLSVGSINAVRGSYASGQSMAHGSKKPILQISVLGERNSGTRWTWG